MRIDQILINGFGKFDKKEIEFDKGFNIVYGTNESGKSTIQAFIKAMLYYPDKKEEKKYLPWGRKEFGAVNIITYTLDNGETYRVEKNFNRKTASVYTAEPYQEVTALFPVKKGNVLFMEEQTGLNLTAFESSVFIKQMEVKMEQKGSKDIIERLIRLSQYGDENIDYNKAIQKLDEIKDAIGLGNTGKYKKLIQVNQTILNLQAEKEKACKNIQTTRELQQKLNLLNGKLQLIHNEIEELSMIKQYKRLPLLQRYEELKNKLEECRQRRKMLEQQLAMYNSISNIVKEDIQDVEKEFERIKLLEKQAEDLKNKIELQTTEKERIQQQTQHESKNFGQAGVRVQLLEDKIAELKNHLNIAKIIGFASSGLSVLGALILGDIHPLWYSLFLLFPIIIMLLYHYSSGIKYRMEQLQLKQQQLGIGLRKYEDLQVINKLIQSLDGEYRQISEKIEEGYLALLKKLAQKGIGDIEKDMLSAVIHELKQAFYARMEILRQMEESEKEIATVSESLEIADKTTASLDWKHSEPIDDQRYRQIAGEYGIEENMTAVEVEQLIETKKQHLKEIELNISSCSKELEILLKEYCHPGDIEEQLQIALNEKQEYEETKEAIEIAKDFLHQSLKEVQQNYTPLLNHHTGTILSAITSGKYYKVDTGPDLDVVIHDKDNGVLILNTLSNGTIDQAYFSLRLAVAHMLSAKEALPLIMDEPFAQYDDERLNNILASLLRIAQERQVILFTCQQRELELLRALNGKYKTILL